MRILLFIFILYSCASKTLLRRDESLAHKQEIKLCFIGDLGHDSPLQALMANELRKEKCNRIFFLGDLIYPDGITSAKDPVLEQNFLRYYRPLLKNNTNLQIPLILGNHDYQGNTEAWKEMASDNSGYYFPNSFYFLDFDGVCVTAIDTNLYIYPDRIAEAAEQTVWLSQLREKLKKCDKTIAVSHHPFDAVGYEGSLDWKGAEGIMRQVLREQVIGTYNYHIAGHLHMIEDDGEKNGTRMLISGTGGETYDNKAGFVVLTWNKKQKKMTPRFRMITDTKMMALGRD